MLQILYLYDKFYVIKALVQVTWKIQEYGTLNFWRLE